MKIWGLSYFLSYHLLEKRPLPYVYSRQGLWWLVLIVNLIGFGITMETYLWVWFRVFSEKFKWSGKTLNVGGSILRLGLQTYWSGEASQAFMSPRSLIVDTMGLIGCSTLLPICFAHNDELCLQTVSPNWLSIYLVFVWYLFCNKKSNYYRISCRSGWPWTRHIGNNDLKFLILWFYHLYFNSSKCPNSVTL